MISKELYYALYFCKLHPATNYHYYSFYPLNIKSIKIYVENCACFWLLVIKVMVYARNCRVVICHNFACCTLSMVDKKCKFQYWNFMIFAIRSVLEILLPSLISKPIQEAILTFHPGESAKRTIFKPSLSEYFHSHRASLSLKTPVLYLIKRLFPKFSHL